MGLDMYLEAKVYVRGWEHCGELERQQYDDLLRLVGLKAYGCLDCPSADVSVRVAYWRKANCIHQWFVEHCQDGRDECQRTHVPREQLRELVDLCKQVLASVETVEGAISTGTSYHPGGVVEHHTRPGLVVAQAGIARNMLPTRGGFFFGSTKYDEGYLADLQSTIDQIEPLLTLPKDVSFYYQASW